MVTEATGPSGSRRCRDLYPGLMGARYDRLHAPIGDLHRIGAEARFEGRCDVERGNHPLGRLACTVFRFPPPAKDVPLRVLMRRDGVRELWRRDFDGHVMRSSQEAHEGIVLERFGPIAVELAPLERDGEMHLVPGGWQLFGLPLPRALAPGGTFVETRDEAGRFVFDIDLRAPVIGRLVRYRGWLERASSTR